MSYCSELSFASGYYTIHNGIVTFKEGTDEELKKKFWEVWKELRPKIIAL